MRHTKSENGYALVIVLFAIVLIVSIAAVFMRGSLSNAKQEINVDQSNLRVVSAEAGVDYYTWSFMKRYEQEKPELLEKINDSIKEYQRKKQQIDYNSIQNIIAESLQQILNEEGTILMSQPSSLFNYQHKFAARDVSILNKDENLSIPILINGTVKGLLPSEDIVDGVINEKKVKTLDFQQIYYIPRLDVINDSGINKGQIIDVPEWINKNKPVDKICPNNKEIEKQDCYANHKNDISKLEEVKKSNVFIDNFFHANEDLDLEEKSTMFVKEDLHIKDELELEGSSKLFVGKDLFIQNQKSDEDDDEGELDIEENSYLFVRRDADVKGEVELDGKSSMYVGRDLKADELEIDEKSNLFVGRELSVSKKIELENKSNICAGELKIKKAELEIEDGSFIYYLNKTDTFLPGKIKQVTTLAELKNKCIIEDYGNISSEIDFSIDPVIKNVIYK